MSQINVSEADFGAVALAAMTAKREGDLEQARALDKVARKINASLSNASSRDVRWLAAGGGRKPLGWRDVPSTIGEDEPVPE